MVALIKTLSWSNKNHSCRGSNMYASRCRYHNRQMLPIMTQWNATWVWSHAAFDSPDSMLLTFQYQLDHPKSLISILPHVYIWPYTFIQLYSPMQTTMKIIKSILINNESYPLFFFKSVGEKGPLEGKRKVN